MCLNSFAVDQPDPADRSNYTDTCGSIKGSNRPSKNLPHQIVVIIARRNHLQLGVQSR